MKLKEAEDWLSSRLEAVYENSEAAAVASLVMEYITALPRSERRLRAIEPLEARQELQLKAMALELESGRPAQYVLGEAWFDGMKLYVDPSVLIPRPETEELVAWIVEDVKARGVAVFEKGEADKTTKLKILDVGTGSGCIALALKKRMPAAEVWGCDVSDEALNIARRNGAALDIRVDFQGNDILDEAQYHFLPTVDIIVSNPPYIPKTEAATMHRNVVEHEPHLALFVPDTDALVFYRALANFGKKRLYPGGTIFLEIHEDLGKQVCELLEAEGYGPVTIRKDMSGKERMVRAEKKAAI